MYEAVIFLVDGFEEVEALAPLDILRRGDAKVASVSLMGRLEVTGSHDITVKADMLFEDLKNTENAMLILPGGPGVPRYKEHAQLLEMLRNHYANGKHIAAICAAPTILGMLGMLADKSAVCHPVKEDELNAAQLLKIPVVTDGNITTSRAAGTSLDFGIELVRILKGKEKATEVAAAILL